MLYIQPIGYVFIMLNYFNIICKNHMGWNKYKYEMYILKKKPHHPLIIDFIYTPYKPKF